MGVLNAALDGAILKRMDHHDLEQMAITFYERHRLDPSIPVPMGRLASMELGPGCIVRGVPLFGADARLFSIEGRRRIALRRGLATTYIPQRIGHELAHPELERIGYREDDLETACDYLGACLVAPAPAIRAMRRALGANFHDMAMEVGSTDTWASLRDAEVTGSTRLVFTRAKVYVRAEESFVLPSSERELRAFQTRKGPGIRRTRLKDDPSRVAVDLEEFAA